uniref:HTH myb-type domain-containing protein n=1 Tax=Caenorhabditis tropicalis TaxID=1561998 RepID=A0A1I7U893_9PELO
MASKKQRTEFTNQEELEMENYVRRMIDENGHGNPLPVLNERFWSEFAQEHNSARSGATIRNRFINKMIDRIPDLDTKEEKSEMIYRSLNIPMTEESKEK